MDFTNSEILKLQTYEEFKISHYLNFIDYTFDVKFDSSCDDKKVVEYYWKDNLSGSLIFEEKLLGIIENGIEERSLVLVDAAADKLIGHIILEMNLNESQLEEMSHSLQIHATRKLKDYLKYF